MTMPARQKTVYDMPIDFDGDADGTYDAQAIHDRVEYIKGLVAKEDCSGAHPYGRSLNDIVVENYRVLLTRIRELEADLDELCFEADDPEHAEDGQ